MKKHKIKKLSDKELDYDQATLLIKRTEFKQRETHSYVRNCCILTHILTCTYTYANTHVCKSFID